jgi:hypothetical protein
MMQLGAPNDPTNATVAAFIAYFQEQMTAKALPQVRLEVIVRTRNACGGILKLLQLR